MCLAVCIFIATHYCATKLDVFHVALQFLLRGQVCE